MQSKHLALLPAVEIDGHPTLLKPELPHIGHPRSLSPDCIYTASSPVGEIICNCVNTAGFQLEYYKLRMSSDCPVQITPGLLQPELQVNLNSPMRIDYGPAGNEYLEENSFLFRYLGKKPFRMDLEKKKDYEFLIISFRNEVLLDFTLSYCRLSNFLTKVAFREPALCYRGTVPKVNAKMDETLRNIFSGTEPSSLFEIKYETYAKMLLIEALGVLYPVSVAVTGGKFDEHTPSWLRNAVDYVEKNTGEKTDIFTVSHNAMVNDFKLKVGFKEYLGTTVKTFTMDLKLTQAVRLMLTTDLKQKEISCEVGYQDPCNLSHAFERELGIRPRRLRQSRYLLSRPFHYET